jgi:hypothetical protein
LLFELAGEQDRIIGLLRECGSGSQQFADAAPGGDPEAHGKIGPGRFFLSEQGFSPLGDLEGFLDRLGILVALLYAGMGGGIDIEPGFLVEVDYSERGMRIAEAFPDLVAGIDKVVLLLLGRDEVARPEG